MERRPIPTPEKPRAEPEIIPPGRERDGAPTWTAADGVHRIYVTRLGPFGFASLVLALAILTVVVVIVLLGAFLIVIPLVGLLLAAAVIAGAMRGRFRRPH